jgi:hypothetical protein
LSFLSNGSNLSFLVTKLGFVIFNSSNIANVTAGTPLPSKNYRFFSSLNIYFNE